MVSVQSRLFLLLLALVGFFAIGLVILHRSETAREDLLLADSESGKRELLQKTIQLKGASLKIMAADYTVWDDMVTFVETGDSLWAQENIAVCLETYKVSAIWVCNPDLSIVYAVGDLTGDSLLPLPLSAEERSEFLKGGMFAHFYTLTGGPLLEVSIAPIQPTADFERKTIPRGFLFAARLWDENVVSDLTQFVDADLSLIPVDSAMGAWTSNRKEAIVRFADTLESWNGRPTAVVLGETKSRLLGELSRAMVVRSWILAGFVGMLLSLLWLSLYFWVTRPLRLIAGALANEDVERIRPVLATKTEFGTMANLISAFFRQNKDLVSEVLERTRAEKALTESAARVEALADEQRILLENARDFIYRHDLSGVFHSVSASVEAVTGYTPEEWMKHYTEFLTDNPVNAQAIELTERALHAGESYPPYPVEIYHKQGHPVLLEISEQPYLKDGKLAGVVGVARDITERRKQEEQQQALQERLDRAERMESIGVLAGGVAHDLNNILGPLVAYPEMIMLKLPADSPIRRQLEIMGRSAKEAADVIQDLLALARRGRYEMKPTNLNEVVKAYLESPNFLSLQAVNRQVSVDVRLDRVLPNLMGSSTHLMKALMNLVVNAFDAMPEGGTLTITTTHGTTNAPSSVQMQARDEGYLQLRVRDTGIGIDPRDLPKIFEPYFSNKEMGKSGSGLGLSVVYGITKDHKGYYDVRSALKKGTEFVLSFPASPEYVEVKAEIAKDCRGQETILVVDDMEEQREIVSDVLCRLEYSVKTAANGHEAVSLLKNDSVDLVILDMIMEADFDGLDAYREILALHPGQKALIVSGFSATDRVGDMQSLGAGAYLRKPYSGQELAEAVRAELDRPAKSGQTRPTTSAVSV
jgi:PAS domain S-box-containing protein